MTFLNWYFVIAFKEMLSKASKQTPPCLSGPPPGFSDCSKSLESIFNFHSFVPFSCLLVAGKGHLQITFTKLCSLSIHLLHLLGAYGLLGAVLGIEWGSTNLVCKAPDSKYFRLCGSHPVSVTTPHLWVCML